MRERRKGREGERMGMDCFPFHIDVVRDLLSSLEYIIILLQSHLHSLSCRPLSSTSYSPFFQWKDLWRTQQKGERKIYIHFQNQPEVSLNCSTTSAGAILLLCPSPTTATQVSVTTGLVVLKERDYNNKNDDRPKWMVWQSRGNLNFLFTDCIADF